MKRITLLAICLLLALSMIASMTSCAVTINAEELSAGYKRTATETPTVDGDFRGAAAAFAFDLLRSIPMEEGENALLSPLSAIACLGMIAGGADGETLAELESVIGMDEETLTRSLYAYVAGLYTGKNCEFRMANSIWTKDANAFFHVREDFLQKNADWYSAEIYRAPFDKETLSDINRWVKKNTDGMIPKMLDALDDDTVMLLINTLVFDAKWQTKYEDAQIRESEFTDYGGHVRMVEMMNSRESVYLEMNGTVGFAKNYEGGAYSFVGLLPQEGEDIYEFARGLGGENFIKMWDGRTSRSINARIPAFSYADDLSLKDALQALGVTDLFDSGAADLSRLGSYDGGNLYCSDVKQKTFIEVSPSGTKAAAVTWGEIKGESAAEPFDPVNIYLDRPFVYAIVDNATGLPLFVGVVTQIGG